MPNFFTDNADMKFRLENIELDEVIRLKENDFADAGEHDYAPGNVEDAVDGYKRVLELVGGISAEYIAPRAEDVDRIGAQCEDGKVTYAPGTREALKVLSQSDLMGFTLPRKYGGLNMPKVAYVAAIEIVARADAALMTIFGLQDIAETILLFGGEEQKDKYLPQFSSGEVTGAMVLTEPDAGSDLQAVRTKAEPSDDSDWWKINGVKRFITNGCADVLLVLARSEAGSKDGRGLSLFITEKGPHVRVRRIEDKLGIHGSPTCELQFNDAPGWLVGQRRRGLTRYVMSLMNGARVAIAAQGLGIAEAAYRDALSFAVEREQFGKAIIDMPPVGEILLNMKVGIESGRALLYETARIVDLSDCYEHKSESISRDDPERAEVKANASLYRKLANILTPMSKYYLCELANKVANDAIQVHGGSGYMRDYDIERYFRDARITNIYEGTTELQVVAIKAGLLGGALDARLEEMVAEEHCEGLTELSGMVKEAHERLKNALESVKERKDPSYAELVGRRLADMVCDVFMSCLLLRDAAKSEEKELIARKFIPEMAARCELNERMAINSPDIVLKHTRSLLGPDVPEV